MGNLMLESWNCFTLARLVSAALTVAVLMTCSADARTRWREPISWYSCSMAPFSVTSRYSLYMLCTPVREV